LTKAPRRPGPSSSTGAGTPRPRTAVPPHDRTAARPVFLWHQTPLAARSHPRHPPAARRRGPRPEL